MTGMAETAAAVADTVLYPAAAEVDATGRVPDSHYALLAAEGFYGLFAPPEAGGPGLDFGTALRVIETLASGCLTTTFTWLQHHGIVMALLTTSNAALRERWLTPAVRGELRGGGAFSGVVSSPPGVRAVRRGDGWSISGRVPFVSGWGSVDVLHVSAHDESTGQVVSGIVDARPGPGVSARPLSLVACQGTSTVGLDLREFTLPDERVTGRVDRDAYLAGLAIGLRVDSALSLGLTGRAVRLIGETAAAEALRTEREELRERFDAALGEPERLPGLRAACSELALRACAAAVVAGGGAALLAEHPAQRLAREALFTLVVASRPAVRSALLGTLAPVGALAAVGGAR
jgi:alkylation response protein AidB-like acyl-CoA dehydrogenase